jgi:hypothetical protein
MIDLIYIIVTLAFFGLMIAYVAACARLGRRASDEAAVNDETRP